MILLGGRVIALIATGGLAGTVAVVVVSGTVPAWLIAFMSAFAIISAAILVHAAWKKPRIGALIERAAIAVLIAFLGVVYSVVAIDTEHGRLLMSTDFARLIVRVAIVSLLGVPTLWVILYITGRLGDGGHG